MGPLGLRVDSSDEGLVQVGERTVACTEEYFEIERKIRITRFYQGHDRALLFQHRVCLFLSRNLLISVEDCKINIFILFAYAI